MDGLKKNNWLFYKDILYRVVIFLVTVTIIVYFLPREGKFNYLYEENKPWRYGLLQASFDFPIYKDEERVKKEQDSILQYFQPYFNLDTEVVKEKRDQLREDYSKVLNKVLPGPEYARYIEQKLHDIYAVGILSSEDIGRLRRDSISFVQIIDKKDAYSMVVSDLFTTKKAYEYILKGDSVRFNPAIIRQSNLNEYLQPNLIYNTSKSVSSRSDLINSVSLASGLVQSGQKIIDRGEIIDKHTYSILESLRKESMKRGESLVQKQLILVGQILFVSILVICFMTYLELFRKDYYQRRGALFLLFSIIILFSVLTSLMVTNNLLSVYIIPYAMLPMIIRIFLDSRTAFMSLVLSVLLASVSLKAPYEFVLLQTMGGLVAIFSLRELSQRSQLFKSALIIVLTYVFINFSYEIMHENDLTKINFSMYRYFVVNGILLLFTYPLLFLLEKVFGFTSNVTLVELSNINNKLLRGLSEVAPGTFQHSMQVANLASEVANKIGAKSQLVRTGALYHDIGKVLNPAFFTENQSGMNPHNGLTHEESAQIIINHVKDGLKLAEKADLPKVIKDFINTHHGGGMTKYFYISYKNEHPDEEVDKSLFTYPGSNPVTKEGAILMMADAVEAASRSLPEYTEESISNLVDKIIDSQVADGFFKECSITFKDIETAKAVFKEKLKIIYHTRVSYPEEIKKKQREKAETAKRKKATEEGK